MCRFRKRPKTLEQHPRAPAPATSHAVDRRRMSYAFQRGNYARDRREARRRERDGDASTVLADARALREVIENQRGDDDDATACADAGAGDVVAKTPEKNGVVDRDLAIGCLRELDGIEEALREDAERDARAEADDATKDEELMEMQRRAEARDRDPRVDEFVDEAKRAVETPEGTMRTREMVRAFAEKMERALVVEPDFYQASLQLAGVYHALGCVTTAIDRACEAHRRTPTCVGALAIAGQMLEDVGLYNRAEEEYARCAATAFDYPDSWIALARLMCVKFGTLTSAVTLMRTARLGGPEGKWTRPGRHPLLLFMLAHALHLNGYSAEPSSLYQQALRAGVGVMGVYPLAKVAWDCGDDDAVAEYCALWRKALEDVDVVDAFFESLESFNALSVGPQWYELLTSKIAFHDAIETHAARDAVRVPAIVTSESVDARALDDDVFVLKGAHRRFPGVYGERIDRVGALSAFRDLIADARSRRSRGELIAQRHVGDALTDELGRKCSIRAHVAFVPNANAANDAAYIAGHVSVCSAVREYVVSTMTDAREDDDSCFRELTNRGLAGDEASAVAREVDFGEVCSRITGTDDFSDDIIAQCEAATAAMRARVRLPSNVVQDAHYDAYAAVGAPVFFDFEFIVQSGDAPRPHLIGVSDRPNFKLERQRSFVRDVWSRVFASLEDDGCDSPAARRPPFARVVAF